MTTSQEVRWLPRPGGRLAFDVSGEGPLVVCVPGMGDVRQTFRHLVPPLVAAGYRVATLDLRGHGASDAGFDRHDVPALASDVAALLDELGGGPAVLVGSSMGASAAALLAAQAPERVRALVLVGPFLRDGGVPRWKALLMRAATARPWAVPVWRAWLPRLYAGRVPADHAEFLAALHASFRRPGHAVAFARTTRSSHAGTEARLGDVRAPALLVVGRLDPDFPDPAAEAAWAAQALGGRVVLVEEAGHYPAAQRPDVVVPAVREFLHEVAARA
ncbi:alpha/beta hydrolase [Kineococcus glutinatus]|uniref:Alpha/beta hydrolase n=1 Tax=Kineococcus glutinatus TaxID=1070872 RepID=A0ABP8VDI3_9ACTN